MIRSRKILTYDSSLRFILRLRHDGIIPLQVVIFMVLYAELSPFLWRNCSPHCQCHTYFCRNRRRFLNRPDWCVRDQIHDDLHGRQGTAAPIQTNGEKHAVLYGLCEAVGSGKLMATGQSPGEESLQMLSIIAGSGSQFICLCGQEFGHSLSV